MAVQFPIRPQISSSEVECKDYFFSHMTAVTSDIGSVEYIRELRDFAVDSKTGKIYVADENARVTIFSETLEYMDTFTHRDVESHVVL